MHQRLLCVLHYPFSSHRKKSVRSSFLTWDTNDCSSDCQALVQEACTGWHFLCRVAFPLLCNEHRLGRLECSLLQGQYLSCRFVAQNRMIINSFLLVSYKSLWPGAETFCGQNPNGSLCPQGVYPQAPVWPVNIMDCQPYEARGAAYVFTTMDEHTGLQDPGLLFSPFLSTCCFTGSVYVAGCFSLHCLDETPEISLSVGEQ